MAAAPTDYEETDFAFVRDLFVDWTPDPMPSAAWAGIVQENGALTPDPEPTGKTEAPTVYAAWTLTYDTLDGDYEGKSAPVRYGRLTVARYTEPGSRKGALRKLRAALLNRLAQANALDGPIGFDLQGSKPVAVGFVGGGWFVENLVVPFAG